MKGLFAINLGEFGWELMNWQAHVRHTARTGSFDHVVVCTYPTSFDLYRDFAHEFVVCDYPGEPICQHKKTTDEAPRINGKWLQEHGCKEYEPYKAKGYAVMWPPTGKADVHKTFRDQDFIRYGKKSPDLAYDVVIHARARGHEPAHNYTEENWYKLIGMLKTQCPGIRMASVGTTHGSMRFEGVRSYRGDTFETTTSVMASSGLVIGTSSGGMHLASLCRAPHVVWFESKKFCQAPLIMRYQRLWNPLRTPCWTLNSGWQTPPAVVFETIKTAMNSLAHGGDLK